MHKKKNEHASFFPKNRQKVMFLFGLWTIPFLNLIWASAPSQDFLNVNLHTVLDLTGTLVRSQTTLNIQNTASKSVSEYTLSFPENAIENHVSWISATQKHAAKDANAAQLKVSRKGNDYKITLEAPLKPQEKTYLVIGTVYRDLVKPFPKQVAQDEKQLLEFLGNVYFYSSYPTARQKMTVRLPNSQKPIGMKEEPAPVVKSGNTIVYGPYSDLPAFSSAPLYLHYVSQKPILVASEVKREIKVSQWGLNLNVLEYYTLHHKGAALKGSFSRVDYLMQQQIHDQTNVVKTLKAFLPPRAYNIIYRDDIGNVSTSIVRGDAKTTLLALSPRYPLYGGWKYKWHHGYDVGFSGFAQKLDGDRFELRLPFTGALKNVSVEHQSVEIALPEGATNIKVDIPFEVDSNKRSFTFTYLDTTGRPTVLLEKKNVVDEFLGPIVITYTFQPIRLFQKPAAVATVLFCILVGLSVFARMDFSITKDPKIEKEERLYKISEVVVRKVNANSSYYELLVEAFKSYKSSRQLDTFRKLEKEILKGAAEVKADFSKLITDARVIDAAYAKDLESLQSLMSELITKGTEIQTKVIEFLTKEGPKDEAKKEIAAAIQKSDDEVVQIRKKIQSLLDKVEL